MAEKKKSAPVSTGPVKPEDKKKALETALAQIEKNFGKGAIMRLGDDIPVNVEAISTGSLSLDLALGIGGVPRGRIVEIYGPESSGKTTLALHILASAQKEGGEVAFIDVEHALEPAYARALGVDIDSLLISQPDTGEQALEITEQLVRSGALDVVVVDSVAALLPRSELEGEMAPPFKIAEFDIMYGLGINYFGELVDLGITIGEVEKSGPGLRLQTANVWDRAAIRQFSTCAITRKSRTRLHRKI